LSDPSDSKLKYKDGYIDIFTGLPYLSKYVPGEWLVEVIDFGSVTALRAELAEAYAGLDAIHDVAMKYQERMKHGDELERAASVARDQRKVAGKTCTECDSEIFPTGFCMMGHYCVEEGTYR
jgi:hypothetical protein